MALPVPIVRDLKGVQQNLDHLSRGGGMGDRALFRAQRSAAVSLASGVVFPFNVEVEDPARSFDAATFRFTPKRRGWYQFVWQVRPDVALPASGYLQTTLRKNGASYRTHTVTQVTGSTPPAGGGEALAFANGTTDYFDVIVVHNAGAALMFSANAAETVFEAHLVAV